MDNANRDRFVQKISDYLAANDLDCVDVDLEGQAVDYRYPTFVTALVGKLRPQGKQVSAALAQWFSEGIPAATMNQFDFISIMAYDHCNAKGTTSPCQHSALQSLTSELGWFQSRGVARDKLVGGVPFYGYKWQSGGNGVSIAYKDVLAQYPAQANTDWFQAGGATVVHNGKSTIQQKAGVGKTYGGVMTWELAQDAVGDAALLKAINDIP
jgi:spore germination protein YaaH